jgi:hypothetical protein
MQPNDTEQDIKQEVVPNPYGAGTRLAHRAKTGLFVKRPKPQSPEQVRKALAQRLTLPLDETGRTHLEEVYAAQLEIAKRTDVENCGTSPTKAAEFCLKSAGMLEHAEHIPTFTSITFTLPALPMSGEIENQPREELRPHFPDGAPRFLEGEVVQQNPQPPAQVLVEQKPKQTLAELTAEYDKL